MDSLKLLLVEDDTGIGRMLERGLSAEGYAVRWARDLREAAASARAEPPDLVVLDRMLPDGDGATFCSALRKAGAIAPVLMLTARETLEDKLRGFEAGADDYLTKPFEFDELLARLTALRRRRMEPAVELVLEPRTRSVHLGSRRVKLTPREWPLMTQLHANPGRAISREELIADAWGMTGQVTENSVDVYMGYLRRKLATLGSAARIETVRGVGFMLVLRG
jgi:DNA-binding response OmpR family regulator